MMHYIFFSYVFFPIFFSLMIYLDPNKESFKGESFWYILKSALGDFYMGIGLLNFLLSPITNIYAIYFIIKYLWERRKRK